MRGSELGAMAFVEPLEGDAGQGVEIQFRRSGEEPGFSP
jgi:hypothetical protein